MSKELEALKNIEKEVEDFESFDENTQHQMDRTRFQIIETALKEHEKYKARLRVVEMKIDSMLRECIDIIEHTEEEDYMRTTSEVRYRTLRLVNNLLKEVLL